MSQMIPPTPQTAAAFEAVRRALRLAQSVRGGGEVIKSDGSPVTVADYGCQALICGALERVTDEPVVGEESADALRARPDLLEAVLAAVRREHADVTGDELCRWVDRGRGLGTEPAFWTVDPIDGTKGFIDGTHYAVALARIEAGEPVVALLGCPEIDGGVVFVAEAGAGTMVYPVDGRPPHQAQVSDMSAIVNARLAESVDARHGDFTASARLRKAVAITAPPVRMHSQAKYGTLALGGAEIYARFPPNAEFRDCIWDHAAGVLIVKEAGGTVTDLDGAPLKFGLGHRLFDNRGILASNGRLHEALLAAATPVGA